MGYTYEVLAWQEVYDDQYQHVQVYAGESLFAAIRAMRKAKKECGCVTLKWRG